jgi:predicted tellurium resistance membrane protein TerC
MNFGSPFPLLIITLAGQTVEFKDLFVVLLLVVLEGVLSIDNALVLGLLAKRLPKHQQPRALSYGLIGAFAFRLLAIGTATFLLQWTFAKFLGGGYLVYIAVKHLFFESHEETPDTVVVDDSGQPQLVDLETHEPLSREREELELQERVPFVAAESGEVDGSSDLRGKRDGDPVPALPSAADRQSQADWRRFWWTVFLIELTDIAFAVDSILAAMGVVGSPPKGETHPKLWVVLLGGFLGVIVMRFAAALFIRLLERFPRFESAAYLLVITIGGKLLVDWGFNSDWTAWGWTANQRWAEQYQAWLLAHWPLPVGPTEHPHLFDFHHLGRPECILFWIAMLAAFSVGFTGHRGADEASTQTGGAAGH